MSFFKSWQFFAFGSALFAALQAVLGRVGVKGVESNFATLIRTVFTMVFIAVVVALLGQYKGLGTVPRRSLVFMGLCGVAGGLSWLCYYHALKLGPVTKVAPIDKLSVVLAIVLALIFLGEQLTLKVAVGGALVTAGAIVLALP